MVSVSISSKQSKGRGLLEWRKKVARYTLYGEQLVDSATYSEPAGSFQPEKIIEDESLEGEKNP